MITFAIPYYRPVIEAMKGKNLSAMRAPFPLYSVHCNPVLWLPFNHLARKALMCAISSAISYRPFAALGEMGAIGTGQYLMYIHNRIILNLLKNTLGRSWFIIYPNHFLYFTGSNIVILFGKLYHSPISIQFLHKRTIVTTYHRLSFNRM